MKYELKDLIDLNRVNDLLSSFNKATGFVTALLDCNGNILSKSGWRNICVEFHRKNQGTVMNCLFSDTVLARKTDGAKEYKVYKCLNGLVDVAIPIIINDDHIGNIFTGQFFFEKPDRDFFIKQASKYGFDTVSYLAALDEVPVVTEDNVKNVMDFLLNMTKMIGDLALIKKEQNGLIETLRTSEAQLSNAMMIAKLGYWEYDVADGFFTFNDRFYDMFRTNVKKIGSYRMSPEQYAKQFVHPDDSSMVGTETRKAIETTDPNFSHQIDHRIIYADGETGYISVRFFIVKDSQGRTVKTYGVNQDITERAKAEDKLKNKVNELKEMNSLIIGRELKMIELKTEINKLLKEMGKEEKYEV